MRALFTAAVVLAIGLALCSVALADDWSAEVSATQGTGPNSWTYTVRNTSTQPYYSLWVFTIEIDDACTVLDTATPDGWSVDTISQPHFITWMYQDGAVSAGAGVSGFEATFSTAPQSQEYTALFYDDEYSTCPYTEGLVTMTAAPEPGSILVLLTGCGPLAVIALKRRRRQ